MNDHELLRKFAATKSEVAFRTLVEQHLPLVFGTARRITRDESLAEDISQTVFLLLARKAREISSERVLSGWFFRTTRFVALRAFRSEHRRRNRETIATHMRLENLNESFWQRVSPELDEALASLNETDRQALLLRFFDGKTLARVAEGLGVSEEAAKKRVGRALEKLREKLARRGVQISSAALMAGLSGEAAAGVPANLVDKISSAGPASLSAGAGVGMGWLMAEVLCANQWARAKMAAGLAAGFASLVFLAMQFNGFTVSADSTAAEKNVAQNPRKAAAPTRAQTIPTTSATQIIFNGVEMWVKSLRIRVLDAADESPIAGARVTHNLGSTMPVTPDRTDDDGIIDFQIPDALPNGHEINQFQAFVRAEGYAQRTIMWLSSTGGVMKSVGPEYTVRLSRGIRLGGYFIDEEGRALEGVKVNLLGNNYKGYRYSTGPDGKVISAPEIRAEDFSWFSMREETQTDKEGRFSVADFPDDLKSLSLEAELPGGARYKFLTDEGDRLTSEKLPRISIKGLRALTERIQIQRGLDVEGMVLDAAGSPVKNASVIESVSGGNLRVLSRQVTDSSGKFRLPNRRPREILLGASATGHGSVSRLITISTNTGLARLTLPPELPLRGRVVDADGQAIANATVELSEHMSDGIGLQWKETTASDGHFSWDGAPTNELYLYVSAAGYAQRVAKLKASPTEHLITLKQGNLEQLHYSGTVTDEVTGEPISEFQIKVHSTGPRAQLPVYLHETTQGHDGKFSMTLDIAERGIQTHNMLGIFVEAAGYEMNDSVKTYVMEGDRDFNIRMRPGGMITGSVLTPAGVAAASATVVISQISEKAWLYRTNMHGKVMTQSDSDGLFKIQKPIYPTACVFAHDSGWAVESVPQNGEAVTVRLKPWASAEITLDPTVPRGPTSYITLHSFDGQHDFPLHLMISEFAGNSLALQKLPAGEFTASFVPMNRSGVAYFHTLQTNFTLAAGGHRKVTLKSEGVHVTAKLKFPDGAQPPPNDVITILTRDVPGAAKRGLEFYATYASQHEGHRQQLRDPALLAAERRQRSYFGSLASDGTVTFPPIPPGRYTFESKQMADDKTDSNREPVVVLQARATVIVSEMAEHSQDLGVFQLEPK